MNLIHCSVYITLFALLAYTLWYNLLYVTYDPPNKFPLAKLKLLTVLNLLFDTIFWGLCFTESLFLLLGQTPDIKGPYRRQLDKLFCSVIFPFGYFVSIMFWGVYAIDRELVLPKSDDSICPRWLNHVQHSLPIICVTIENIVQNRMYLHRKLNLKIVIVVANVYYSSVLYWYFFDNGFWVYPLLAAMNWSGRIAFHVFVCSSLVVFYFCGEILNNYVWGNVKSSFISVRENMERKSG